MTPKMAQNVVKKKAIKPEATLTNRLEKKPNRPMGMPKSVASAAVVDGDVEAWGALVIVPYLFCVGHAAASAARTQLEYRFMIETAQIHLLPALEVARETAVQQAPNGICYASFGHTHLPALDLDRMVQAVPQSIASALGRKAYYFVPLALGETEETLIAPDYTTELGDRAVCHRNVSFNGADCVFISTRMMRDRFALAFEFFINAGHHFVDAAGVPESFSRLAWAQAEANVRGETSQDAWENRKQALANRERVDEKARAEYLEAAFSDAIAIYLLSLTVDFDYAELREREYPLLAPQSLAERLRHIAEIFPPNAGFEFAIRYRRRSN